LATTEPQRRHRGELEAGVLTVLWAAGRALTPGDVQRALPGELARTTVNTILARLHEKGVLVRTRTGRAFAYTPAQEAQDASALAARRMRSELEKQADRQTVLSRFVSGLNQDDEDLLRGLLEAGRPDQPTDTAQPADAVRATDPAQPGGPDAGAGQLGGTGGGTAS
jgi:predicted transcriptional regulator